MHRLTQGMLVAILAAAPRLGWAMPAPDDGGPASTGGGTSAGTTPSSPLREYGAQTSPIRDYGQCHGKAAAGHHEELRSLEKAEHAALKSLHSSPGWKSASPADRESQTKALKESYKARRESLQASFTAAQKECKERRHPLPPERMPPGTSGGGGGHPKAE